MKTTASILTTLLLAASITAFGQTAGQDMKDAGSDVKGAAKSTGKATKKTAKTAARKTKHGTHKAAKKLSDKTQ